MVSKPAGKRVLTLLLAASAAVAGAILLRSRGPTGSRPRRPAVLESRVALLPRLDRALQSRGFPDDRRFLTPFLDAHRNVDRDEVPFLMPVDGAADFLDLPCHTASRLDFAYGFEGVADERFLGVAVDFFVRGRRAGGTTWRELFHARREASARPELERARATLPAEWSGGRIDLRFETRCGRSPPEGAVWPVFASPVLVSEGCRVAAEEDRLEHEDLVLDFLARFDEDRRRMEESDDWEWVVHTPTRELCFAVVRDEETGREEVLPITASGRTPAMVCDERPRAPGGGARPALFFEDDQVILQSRVRIPDEGARLRFAIGVDERSVGVGAAEFVVEIDGEPRFDERLDPEAQPAQRGWLEREVDLSAFAGREVTVSFRGEVEIGEPRTFHRLEPQPLGPARPVTWTVRRVRGGFARPRLVRVRRVLRRRSEPGRRPSVVLVNVETFRADDVGAYGGGGGRTPVLDRLAAEGLRVDDCVTVAPWTAPSVASLFTGLYPLAHGVTSYAASWLPDEVTTLAERAAAAGVTTFAVTTNELVSRAKNFDQGFETFLELPYANARQVVAVFDDWLADRADAQFFAYLHLFDPHHPYNAPGEAGRRDVPPELADLDPDRELERIQNALLRGEKVAEDDPGVRLLRALYRGEIRYLDRQLGRLVEALERHRLVGRVVLVVTGDHGEEFLEHGLIGHGSHVFGESVRVPLVLWGPGLVPRGVGRGPVENARLFETVARLLDLPATAGREPGVLPGIDLQPGDLGSEAYVSTEQGIRRILLDGRRPRLETKSIYALYTRDAALLRSPPGRGEDQPGETLLFDLRVDPGQRRDVSARRGELLRRLSERLASVHRFALSVRHGQRISRLDAATLGTLSELGYVAGSRTNEEGELFPDEGGDR